MGVQEHKWYEEQGKNLRTALWRISSIRYVADAAEGRAGVQGVDRNTNPVGTLFYGVGKGYR